VPPLPEGGLTDDDLLQRLRAIYPADAVKLVAKELQAAREAMRDGLADESYATAIHERYTYRMTLLVEGAEKLREVSGAGGVLDVKVVREGMRKEVVEAELAQLERSRDMALGRMLRCRVRYFSDGAVLGSREFVDGVFRACRDRFGEKRKSGARKLRGSAAAAAGTLWSARDLKKGIG
jgi:hypothetical protein